jgi:peptide methionine sulfoxide reductase msrA/msrB
MVYKSQSLPPEILNIIVDKGTEFPFTGEYDEFDQAGSYLCRQCGLALFRSQTKFHSGCGWPSFDEEINGAVIKQADHDGIRTEIVCARCKGHLGHVFQGEQFTDKNTRHCVNAASLDFVSDLTVKDTAEVIFAAGCFWGVEYYFQRLPGVLKTEVGYTGGHKDHPTYNEVCAGNTGHVEAIRVVYDKTKCDDEILTKYFFEIHNPVQIDGQGPDRGEQYLSVIFYYDDEQKYIAEKLISQLEKQRMKIATKILPVSVFWRAEDYHQHYYDKSGKEPYCHRYEKRFFATSGKT